MKGQKIWHHNHFQAESQFHLLLAASRVTIFHFKTLKELNPPWKVELQNPILYLQSYGQNIWDFRENPWNIGLFIFALKYGSPLVPYPNASLFINRALKIFQRFIFFFARVENTSTRHFFFARVWKYLNASLFLVTRLK